MTAAITSWTDGTLGTAQTWLVNPGVPIPERATAVHGITTEYAHEHGADPATALNEINDALAQHLSQNAAVVIFNAGYDLTLLEADSRRNGVAPLSQRVGTIAPVLDPLVLDRALVRFRKGRRTLSDLCMAYGVEISTNAHNADADVAMTLALMARIMQQHPQLQGMSATEITQFQRESHEAWAEDFERYLRSQGKDSHISRIWF